MGKLMGVVVSPLEKPGRCIYTGPCGDAPRWIVETVSIEDVAPWAAYRNPMTLCSAHALEHLTNIVRVQDGAPPAGG